MVAFAVIEPLDEVEDIGSGLVTALAMTRQGVLAILLDGLSPAAQLLGIDAELSATKTSVTPGSLARSKASRLNSALYPFSCPFLTSESIIVLL